MIEDLRPLRFNMTPCQTRIGLKAGTLNLEQYRSFYGDRRLANRRQNVGSFALIQK